MNEVLLVDNSNVFCGLNLGIGERFDYLKFCQLTFANNATTRKILVGSTPPSSDSFWQTMQRNGFEVITFARRNNVEKAVDTEIVAQGLDVLNEYPQPGRLVIMSGDGDMLPLVRRAVDKGWRVEIWSWRNSLSNEYQKVPTIAKLQYLDDIAEACVFSQWGATREQPKVSTCSDQLKSQVQPKQPQPQPASAPTPSSSRSSKWLPLAGGALTAVALGIATVLINQNRK